MEAALQTFDLPSGALSPSTAVRVVSALERLRSSLSAALPGLVDNQQQKASSVLGNGDSISASWLLNVCASVHSELEPVHLAKAIVEAAALKDEAQQQAALFDALGASEQAMDVLMKVAPVLSEIRQNVTLHDLERQQTSSNALESATHIDIEEERRQFLLSQAIDTAQVAAVAKAELEALNGPGSSSQATHTVLRTSEIAARKFAEKAQKRANQAFKRAKEAGAILDENDLLTIQPSQLGDGGLVNRSENEVLAIQQSLLPEGSRQYYDDRGLPKDAIREVEGDIERVIIPAPKLDKSSLPKRLKIAEIMDEELGRAFAGTASLNPMQSSTFDVAFHSRDNMLVCAPTGAGKTNVAMLAVVSHFRDVGLLGKGGALETGTKVIYIAPMKALAQEVVEKFSSKLKPLRLVVRELTGDMQLSRAEAESADVIVTTPEKWDVVTRKSGTDENSLGNQCGLLIIDEVHLLADERGAVIESVVSRLHRLIESRQRQVRIVALSATLPNYDDVAEFLQVSERGLFYFGPEHRPVPLQQTFVGVNVNVRNRTLKEQKMNEVCFDIVLDSLQRGYQVMVFVHSRKNTGDTASALAELASQEGVLESSFVTQGKAGPNGDAYNRYAARVAKSRNGEVRAHFQHGMGIHHAGMLRGDRKLSEQMFNDGAIKVLCCTATLAWGINLPAHSVVVKGTDVYKPEKGGIVDLSILDVMQIFGRAGRPQFDRSGEATLITTNDAFSRYMDKLVRPIPIESSFIKQLADHLNAEIVGGTVSNLREAARWLTYTYLYVRMMRNPLAYGISADQKADDPTLSMRCLELVKQAAKQLDESKMIRANLESGNLSAVSNGRVAAHFYIQEASIATFNERLEGSRASTDADLTRTICSATEFQNLKLRQEELDELQKLAANECPFPLSGAGDDGEGRRLVTDSTDKAYVLLQSYISRARIRSFTLISDTNYIAQNSGRVARALFEICIKSNSAVAATKLLRIAKSIDNQNWWFKTPLRHFSGELHEHVFSALETKSHRGSYSSFDSLLSLMDMLPEEVGQIGKCRKQGGEKIQLLVGMLPKFDIDVSVKPITSNVLRIQIYLAADFEWHGRWHGGAQSFWLWVEDSNTNKIHYHEQFVLSRRGYAEPFDIDFSIPLFQSASTQYFVRIVADGWVGVEQLFPVPVGNIELPKDKTLHTDLLDLTPLPTSALNNPAYERLYSKFETFNPIQTQLFHVLYHTDVPVLLGAPTGSGKTVIAELAVLRMKKLFPKAICVYIAPLKALARERLKEWKARLGMPPLKWSVLELTGDTHHDKRALDTADILICTPEKWDLISRGWRGSSGKAAKSFVSKVRLLVMDEVHLLGEERGAVLEAIVSRTRFISRFMEQKIKDENSEERAPAEMTRIIGLSTMLANPIDLADWIGIKTTGAGAASMRGLYNFRSSVRPVPTTVHIQGYPGKHYCPRMATMNRPCYAAIRDLSPTKPSLIFVASRRQTRLTAFDIISYAAADESPKLFLGCSDAYVETVAENIDDEALRHTITFGIGLHHAGLSSKDRDVVENMFLKGEIRVLVATATLAWGVNLPAHLVIVKGTEYFDGKSSRYVDYPLTDVLQMIGRAGRPGFDTEADAVVMVAEDKKNFYKKFLYIPFPVESCLDQRINENLNAEIASGTIGNMVDAVGYLSWTFYARRIKSNPSFYGALSGSEEHVEERLVSVVNETFARLKENGCLAMDGEDRAAVIHSTILGNAAAQFYLTYRTPRQLQFGIREARRIIVKALEEEKEKSAHTTYSGVRHFDCSQKVDEQSIAWILYVLSSSHEFDELPVRHNEEFLNQDLSAELMWGPDTADLLAGSKQPARNIEIFEDPHTKCFLLLQGHLERASLPISDYVNDTKSVVENIPRLLAALSFVSLGESSAAGSLHVQTQLSRTRQLFVARARVDDDPLLQLPGVTRPAASKLRDQSQSLYKMRQLPRSEAINCFKQATKKKKVDFIADALYRLPAIEIKETLLLAETNKTNQKMTGKLKVTMNMERMKPNTRASSFTDSLTLTLLLGSYQQGFLLGHATARVGRQSTSSTISRELPFDWSQANADGGQNTAKVILRVLVDEIRGLDLETILELNPSAAATMTT